MRWQVRPERDRQTQDGSLDSGREQMRHDGAGAGRAAVVMVPRVADHEVGVQRVHHVELGVDLAEGVVVGVEEPSVARVRSEDAGGRASAVAVAGLGRS